MKLLLSILIVATAFDIFAAGSTYETTPTNVIAATKEKIANFEAAKATGYFLITTNQESEIKRRINGYENRKLKIEDLTFNAGSEDSRRLIGYYLIHSNDISAKIKLPISLSYVAFCAYPEAIKLATGYAKIFPKDSYAWRVLGNAYTLMDMLYNSTNASDAALEAYTKAVELGDKESLGPLCVVAFKNDRMNVIGKFVPNLMDLKQSKHSSAQEKLNAIKMLIAYSLKTERKDVFVKALKGVNMEEVFIDDSVEENVAMGCQFFSGKEIEKIRRQMEKAEQKDPQAGSPH